MSNQKWFEIWKQDIANDYIDNRIFNTQNLMSRDIDVESKLFKLGVWNPCDTLSPEQIHNLNKDRPISNKLIYRQYHNNEINSLCFPNQDKEPWGNTTKTINQ